MCSKSDAMFLWSFPHVIFAVVVEHDLDIFRPRGWSRVQRFQAEKCKYGGPIFIRTIGRLKFSFTLESNCGCLDSLWCFCYLRRSLTVFNGKAIKVFLKRHQ